MNDTMARFAAPAAVVTHSGGLDSTVLLTRMLEYRYDVVALHVNYGQRHNIELNAARAVTSRLREHYRGRVVLDVDIDLRGYGAVLNGSALTSRSTPVPEGHYSAASMAATVVPNRNAIILNIAAGIAVAHGIGTVATAVHRGDHAVYPDCRPEFIHATRRAIELATDGAVRLGAPYIGMSKADIVGIGDRLGAPMDLTWSCYNPQLTDHPGPFGAWFRHCGRCGTCVERAEAFHRAGVVDPTDYEDAEYWRTAVAAAADVTR